MKSYNELKEHFSDFERLEKLQEILVWDREVMMPSGSASSRAELMAAFESTIHSILNKPLIKELIDKVENQQLSNQWDKRNFALMQKKHAIAVAIPKNLVEESAKAIANCLQSWKLCRPKNDWNSFRPYLEKVIALDKEKALIRAQVTKSNPYDSLLDQYSPGLTQEIIDPLFNNLQPKLTKMLSLARSNKGNQYATSCSINKQTSLCKHIMKKIGFDFNLGRLDVSHHPFCAGYSNDMRVTTRYDENDFLKSLMAVCHETGHSLYEQNLPKQWQYQPVGNNAGMAIHESQSLLLERQVCQTREFIHYLCESGQKFVSKSDLVPDLIYKRYSSTSPSLIRVESDEIAYALHIILRYNIEKRLVNDELKVADLPDAWNYYMEKLMGISTKDDYENGVMQDIHWSGGGLGYFPSYLMGSIFAVELFAKIKEETPDVLVKLKKGDFSDIFAWLHKHIHHYGGLYDTIPLINRAIGRDINTESYEKYLHNKYVE